MNDLQRILSLAIAPDVYERARAQITRVRIQEKLQERFAHLKTEDKRQAAIKWIKAFDDRFAEGFLQDQLRSEDPETRLFAGLEGSIRTDTGLRAIEFLAHINRKVGGVGTVDAGRNSTVLASIRFAAFA